MITNDNQLIDGMNGGRFVDVLSCRHFAWQADPMKPSARHSSLMGPDEPGSDPSLSHKTFLGN